jgi:hypothetical protein
MRAYVGVLSVARIRRKIYKQAGFLGSAIGEERSVLYARLRINLRNMVGDYDSDVLDSSGSGSPPLIPPPASPPAPPPAPEKGPERLTISDDRSAGSNLEVRNLVALKDRTASDKSPEPSRALTLEYAPPESLAKFRRHATAEIPLSAAERPVGYAQMQQRFGQLQFDKAMAIGADSSEMNDPNTSSKTFRIQVWKWSFDGDFKRQRDDVLLRVTQKTTNISIEATEWNMHDLDIYPLRLASRSVVNQLRCRGRMFWRCRKRCLISYQEWGTEAQDEVGQILLMDAYQHRSIKTQTDH